MSGRLRIKYFFMVVSLVVFMNSGCVIIPHKTKLKEEVSLPQSNEEQQKKTDGSLWQDDGQLSTLFVAFKARKVGDIVTIKIAESSTGTHGATTTNARKSDITGQITNLFNLESTIAASKSFNPFSSVNSTMQNNFSGNGTTQRNGSVSAYITARVSEVLPNGDLKIIGSRDVSVNHENQHITISGVIRTKDISNDNVILSTYIGDAKITYNGNGVVDDLQHPGWMARILNRVWPF